MFTASEKEPHWYRDNILIVSVLTSFPTNSSEQDSAIQLRASWTPEPFFTSPTLSTRSPSTKPADTLVNTVFLPRWASRSIFNFSTCYKKIKFSPLLPWFITNLSFKQFFSIKITFILYQFVFIGSVRGIFQLCLTWKLLSLIPGFLARVLTTTCVFSSSLLFPFTIYKYLPGLYLRKSLLTMMTLLNFFF